MAVASFVIYWIFGILLSRRLFFDRGTAEKTVFASVFCTVAGSCFPALFAAVFGFGVLACSFAAGSALVLGLAAALIKKPRAEAAHRPADGVFWGCTAFFTLLCTYLALTHVLLPDADGALHCGQSTFGDMPMHLAFITSMVKSGTFPPVYSLVAGNVPLGYPFLCETFSAALYALGMPLRYAYILPMIPAFFSVFGGAYLFFMKAADSDRKKALLAMALFFIGGGFGFAYFFENLRVDPGNFSRIFSAFYETPTNYVSHNIYWVNPICDLLIPQRATLFGWATLFPALYLLWSAAMDGETKDFLILGVLAGTLPLTHTHSFLALALVSLVLFVRALIRSPKEKKTLLFFLAYGGIAAALSVPQLLAFTFRQSAAEGFLTLHLNWINEKDAYLWFYLKNIGPILLLLPAALIHAKPKVRWLYCGGLLILVLCEFIRFQPNAYDNNKLLYVWHLLGCVMAADLLIDLWRKLSGFRARTMLALLLCPFFFLSGALTIGREIVSDYVLFDSEQVAAADFIDGTTPDSARFLTGTQHNNAIASLAGRNIVCGSGSYLYFHGLDYAAAEQAVREMYEMPSEEALKAWGVDYVVIGAAERSNYTVFEAFYQDRYPEIYHTEQISIYKTGS